ncbi:MAG: hypothetical protein E6J72_15395 [Deltaproteobacteria bacterium]|nr:MAG: hypothetical protein E6J72_15395 [Deltaproteobacteria bacterium]
MPRLTRLILVASALVASAMLAIVPCTREADAFDSKLTFGACSSSCDSSFHTCANGCCLFDTTSGGKYNVCSGPCLSTCQSNLAYCAFICGVQATSEINDTAVLSANGRHLALTLPVTCTEGLSIKWLGVTVTQPNSGALAKGHLQGTACTGSSEPLVVDAIVQDSDNFSATDQAEACGLLRVGESGRTLYSHQWCRTVQVLPEGATIEE